ncbi:DUF7507 domain-containing protein [Microbacterium oxydans]|uniref:DUF7507 domain-containing protein n=1 Tax=Microbacterium oxydans TaxID=82380 RepID=UPI0024ADF24C|nr:GEVED domain-containing protein [Microbacterium oxydans]
MPSQTSQPGVLSDGREEHRRSFLARLRVSRARRKPFAVVALLTLVLAGLVVPATTATAAPGDAAQLYLGPSYEAPVVGSDKDLTAPTECPSNSVLTGVQTENRQNISPTSANAILTRFAVQCSTITVSNAGVITGTVNPAWINGPVYDQSRGNLQTGTCPANTFVHRITGTTFVGDNGARWPSSVQITCRPMILTGAGQLRVNLAATPTVLTIGQDFNTNGGLQTPTPRCGPGDTTGISDILVRGYRAQSGGEGIDGFNPSCATVPDDFGDAPASYGSVSHELNAATYLGWSADAETAMQYSANATGDNLVGGTAPNQFINDENGVSTFGPITAGITSSYSVSVLVANKAPGTTATLVGWVDFNRNGVFDTNEGVSAPVPAGTPDGSSVTLTWPGIISQTVAGPTFARFRIASGTDLTSATPTGAALTGEVEDYALTIAAANPGISVLKAATPSGPESFTVGQVIDYSFLVTNTGDVPLTGVAVTETAFNGTGTMSPPVCPTTTLAAGASTTCTASYTLTQADIDRGSLSNTATATGTPPGILTPPVSPPSTVTVPAAAAPAITLVKSANTTEITSAGQAITYSFLVTNTGNVTLSNVSVAETAFSGTGTAPVVTCPAGAASLAPAAQVTCQATYTTTTADYRADSLDNTATATGTPPSGTPPVSPPSTLEIPVVPAPALTVTKTADLEELTAAGQTINYSFLVTNTGNVTITDVSVTETAFTGTGTAPVATCPAGAASLAAGASVTCTASYVVTQADMDAGGVTNTATTTGTPPTGTPPVSPPSTVEVPVGPDPGISVVKSASPNTADAYVVGQEITYSFVVTNTGNVTLTDVTVDEGTFTGSGTAPVPTCPAGAASLAPGVQVVCTASYVLTQADVDAGSVSNSATATGVPPTGTPPVSPPSTTEVPVDPAPAMTVVKSADLQELTAAGQTINYSFVATNTGNVTLTDVTITETAFSGTGTPPVVTCPAGAASLVPGANVTCTASYVVTQADMDAGGVTNTATTTGTPPTGTPPVSPPSTTEVPVAPAPAMTVVKSADLQELTAAGQTINYSFLVSNTGNVTLTDVSVTETAFSGTGTAPVVTCPAGAASLAPGADVTCTASYVVTQADIDAGGVTNTATTTGTPPTGTPPVSPPSTTEVPVAPAPAMTVVKSADLQQLTAAGQTINYAFLVTNTGNVTLTGVTVTETAFSGTGTAPVVTCPAGAASLAPGADVTCTASYVVTQADMDAGGVTNTATTTGTPPTGTPPVSPPSTVEVPVGPDPGISVVKSASPNTADAYVVGQEITYSFVVTNTGNVTLTDVTVDEGTFTGSGTAPVPTCPAGAASLAPGVQVVCTASYVLTQADVDAGSVSNSATATGVPPTGTPPVSPPSTTEVPVDPAPGVSIVKSATPETMTTVGQTLSYSFVVTNTGNVTLTDVTVDETAFSGSGSLSAIECPAGAASVLPGQIVTCTAEYRTTQADVDAGLLTNTATATGTPPSGQPPVSPPSTVEVPFDGDNSLGLEKRANPVDVNGNGVIDPGDRIEWTIIVTNTGAQTIADIVVSDPTAGAVTCPATSLVSGEQMTCTVPPHTVTAADVRSGQVRNVATATGTPPGGDPIDPPTSETTTRVFPPPPPTLAVTGGTLSVGLVLGGLMLVVGSALLRRRRLS